LLLRITPNAALVVQSGVLIRKRLSVN
jgi:hypothetical protein